jgi:MoxR-like ATPase
MSGVERLAASEYAPRQGLKFIDVFGLHGLYDGMAFNSNLVLVGPKGIGKTLSFQTYAAKTETPIITFDCSEDVRRSHLIGHHIMRGGETPFVLGPLTTAFEVANEVGRCILVLEEVNGLAPQMQKVLNGLADFRRRIEVPECQRIFKLEPTSKLWFVGTMNTAVYGGVYALNEDLKSRFRLLALDYPTPAQEKAIIDGVLDPALLKKLIEDYKKDGSKIIDRVLQLAIETRQKALEYTLSPRDVQQLIEDIALVGLPRALRVLIGKFDGEDRSFVKQRIQSIFGVMVSEGTIA